MVEIEGDIVNKQNQLPEEEPPYFSGHISCCLSKYIYWLVFLGLAQLVPRHYTKKNGPLMAYGSVVLENELQTHF